MRPDLIEDLESVVRLLNDGGWDADVAVVQEAITALEAIESERNAKKQSSIDPQCAGRIFLRHPLDRGTSNA